MIEVEEMPKQSQPQALPSGAAWGTPTKWRTSTKWGNVFMLAGLGAALVLAELIYKAVSHDTHHAEVQFQSWFAFPAMLSFVGVSLLVGIAQVCRSVLGSQKEGEGRVKDG